MPIPEEEDAWGIHVDEKNELWRFYGTAHDGTRIWEPIQLVYDDSRDHRKEQDFKVLKELIRET